MNVYTPGAPGDGYGYGYVPDPLYDSAGRQPPPRKQQMVIMVGLPKSGKTTRARERYQQQGFTRVCPDDLRMALYGQRFIATMERFVWAIAETMCRTLLYGGHNVVIDATNLTLEGRKRWLLLAHESEAQVTVEIMDTPVEQCLARNAQEENINSQVPPAIITEMVTSFEQPRLLDSPRIIGIWSIMGERAVKLDGPS